MDEARIGQVRREFQSLERQNQNASVWKGKARIRMLGRIRPEIHCLKGKGENSSVNVSTYIARIPVLERIRSEF